MKRYPKKILAGFAGLAIVLLTMGSACDDTATPTSMCAFVINDGQSGRDAKIDHIAYPGDTINTIDKIVKYFPCNSRNFIVNDGTVKNANGDRVGDRFTRTVAYTKEGSKVYISWKKFWTVNQTKKVLETDFYPFCYKYDCYSGDASVNDANYSDKGWNGMLGENNSPAGDAVLQASAKTVLTDNGVQSHDRDEWAKLAEAASNGFADAIRVYTGYPDDLFCGSGNSGWSDPDKPGKGKFTCSNVRFTVDDVQLADTGLQDLADRQKKAEKEKAVNKAELDAAKEKYGTDGAGYWLGLQDTLKGCKESKTTCVVNVGGGNAPTVSVPAAK